MMLLRRSKFFNIEYSKCQYTLQRLFQMYVPCQAKMLKSSLISEGVSPFRLGGKKY